MSGGERRQRIGFTGHQGLTADTEAAVAKRIATYLQEVNPKVGFCSLAEGADQIFAELLLVSEAELVAVIPCRNYEETFTDEVTLQRYRRLLGKATRTIALDFASPGEDAYWAAGQKVVEESDDLIAVWDGEKAKGLGGTGDVVAYARKLNRNVKIIWPEGSARK